MRTHATFRSDRFAVLPESARVDSVAGEDLAWWLANALRPQPGLDVGIPVQVDWSWQVPVAVGHEPMLLVAGLRAPDASDWCVSVTPATTLDTPHGGRLNQASLARLLELVHTALQRLPGIRDLGWHDEVAFSRGALAPSSSPFDASTESA